MQVRSASFRAARGFTLLEVIIAASLTAALLSVVAHTLVRAVNIHQRQVVRSELLQNGQVALDRITRELRTGGAPVIEPGAITFPVDTDGDDVFDALLRFEKSGDQIRRQQDAETPQVLAEKVASLTFSGTDLTTVNIVLEDEGESMTFQMAVRHEN